ncbi:MAG: DinB family protein [Trueperaceae bacterium]|nr:DinB family protein [Trueperaceae bacterium]
MNICEMIQRQYHAALGMLGNSIKDCPVELWNKGSTNKYWHIAYHTLFYTHLYLSESDERFEPWEKGREGYNDLSLRQAEPLNAYSQAELLEYLELCHKEVDTRVPGLDFEAPSGFDWLPFGKLELQIYNIRHIQHHTGQLIDRLREAADISSNWIGK